jgi:hypothetical protein
MTVYHISILCLYQLYYFVYNDGRSHVIWWALISILMEPTFSGKLSWSWIPICCLNTFFPIDDLCLSYSHFLPNILNDFQTSAHNMPQPWKPNHSCMSWHHSLAILVPLPTSRYRCRTACWLDNKKDCHTFIFSKGTLMLKYYHKIRTCHFFWC